MDSGGHTASLRRSLSLPLLTFYGLGTILGAGIYVLVGEVAGEAGYAAPLAFLFAGVVAAVTAFSYSELASRIPRSAGEAAYLREAFDLKLPAMLAGWGVVLTGIVSAATITNGFAGYLGEFVAVPRFWSITVSIAVMGAIAAWGVGASVGAASVVTVFEILGLVLVCSLGVGVAMEGAGAGGAGQAEGRSVLLGVFLGGFLAFFAFIGFEDIVNMSEEVREPRRNVPRAILISMAIATLLYMLVATIAVRAVPPAELAGDDAPLVRVVGGDHAWARPLIGGISMAAVINGALIQIIMASRVMFGMARQQLGPRFLGYVHPNRQTPMVATLLATGVIWTLAVAFPLTTLARITSTITLMVFSLVNAALIRIKMRNDASAVEHAFRVPIAVPVIGLVLCVGCLLGSFFARGH